MNGNYFIFKNNIMTLLVTSIKASVWGRFVILLLTRDKVGTYQPINTTA